MRGDIRGGNHLGKVRSWIQWHALNGSTVTWGSEEHLQLRPLTVSDLEKLAQDIGDGAVQGKLEPMRRCLETLLAWTSENPPEKTENSQWDLYLARNRIQALVEEIKNGLKAGY